MLLILAALLACKKKKEDPAAPPASAPAPATSPNATRAAELKPKVKSLLATLGNVAKKAKSEPAVRSDRPLKEKLDEKSFVILGDKWLSNVHYEPTDAELGLDDTTLALCEYRMEKTDLAADDIGYLEKCVSWKWVAVVRPRRIEMPKVKLASKSFDPGTVQGDVLLFELASGEIKGRYTMNITNSDKLTWFEGKPESEWSTESKRDLVENVDGVIRERLALERDSMGK